MYSLGQLIRSLEKCDQGKDVVFDFCYCVPTDIASWRGVYAEPALGWKPSGYSGNGHDVRARELISKLKVALDTEYTAWKGGEYRYSENDHLHIDNPGDCTHTEIEGVVEDGYKIIINTRCEEPRW